MIRSLLKRWLYQPYSATVLPEYAGTGSVPFVGPANALRYAPVYRAVSLIASDIARIEITSTSSAAESLLRSPSRWMSAYEFRRAATMQVLLFGNAFALINRTRGGELLELVLLATDSVSLDLSSGEPVYRTQQYGDLPAEQILHLRAPNLTGLWGESPVSLCRVSMQLMAAQDQMALSAYSNGGNPKIALIHPGALPLEARQRLANDYEARHSGTANAGRPIVLSDGMRIERVSSTLDDAGLQAARLFSINDVARIYGVPPLMLGEAMAGNASGSLEWTGRQYVDHCLQPWISAWVGEIQSKLASPFDSVAFDVDGLKRPGLAETMAALRTGVEAGVITRNEARARLDLEPLEGLDEPTLALNVGTGGGSTNIGADTSMEAGTPNDF